MKKDVLVTVTGLIYTGDGEDEKDYIDVITPGKYYQKEGRHILVYEEMLEGCDEPIRNFVTITPDHVKIRKSGIVCSEMEFRTGETRTAFYSTPFGELEMSAETSSVTLKEREEELLADIRYTMTINGIQKNNCFVKILVQPKGEGSGFSVAGQK